MESIRSITVNRFYCFAYTLILQAEFVNIQERLEFYWPRSLSGVNNFCCLLFNGINLMVGHPATFLLNWFAVWNYINFPSTLEVVREKRKMALMHMKI